MQFDLEEIQRLTLAAKQGQEVDKFQRMMQEFSEMLNLFSSKYEDAEHYETAILCQIVSSVCVVLANSIRT